MHRDSPSTSNAIQFHFNPTTLYRITVQHHMHILSCHLTDFLVTRTTHHDDRYPPAPFRLIEQNPFIRRVHAFYPKKKQVQSSLNLGLNFVSPARKTVFRSVFSVFAFNVFPFCVFSHIGQFHVLWATMIFDSNSEFERNPITFSIRFRCIFDVNGCSIATNRNHHAYR